MDNIFEYICFILPQNSWLCLRWSDMTWMGSGAGQSGPPKVIIHIQDIGEQRLGGGFLDVQLLHLLGHHDCLPGDLLAWPGHLEEPWQPLQEH